MMGFEHKGDLYWMGKLADYTDMERTKSLFSCWKPGLKFIEINWQQQFGWQL